MPKAMVAAAAIAMSDLRNMVIILPISAIANAPVSDAGILGLAR
jgi:hypothetical protein